MTFQELLDHASHRPLFKEQVEACRAQEGLTVGAFCDRVAREIAHGYAENRLTFAFCDMVMDHLFRCLTAEYHEPPSDYAYSVFSAFDEGEYHHPTDPLAASAEEMYTRPLIAQIIAGGQAH